MSTYAYDFPLPSTQVPPYSKDSLANAESTAVDKDSLLYVMLPKLFKNRIRRIPSLRRSVSGYSKGLEAAQYDSQHSRRSSTEFPIAQTPPPEYRAQGFLSEASSENGELEEEEEVQQPAPQPLQPSTPVVGETIAPLSGINWRFAAQGLSLLNLASDEASAPASGSAPRDASLARQLYIHAITYLLRGLPEKLTTDEQMSVLSALPQEVIDQHRPSTSSSSESNSSAEPRLIEQAELAESSPSVLHRALAALVVQIFLFINFLLPHIKAFLTWAYKYERQHRLSERIFASGVGTMGSMLRRAVELGNTVCSMNDGKVGHALNDLTLWWIRGVTGGIHQGVGEGLVLMGVDASQGQRTRKRAQSASLR